MLALLWNVCFELEEKTVLPTLSILWNRKIGFLDFWKCSVYTLAKDLNRWSNFTECQFDWVGNTSKLMFRLIKYGFSLVLTSKMLLMSSDLPTYHLVFECQFRLNFPCANFDLIIEFSSYTFFFPLWQNYNYWQTFA